MQVKALSEIGVKELTLLGQNVNSYADFSEQEQQPSQNGSDAFSIYAKVFLFQNAPDYISNRHSNDNNETASAAISGNMTIFCFEGSKLHFTSKGWPSFYLRLHFIVFDFHAFTTDELHLQKTSQFQVT